MQDQTNKKIPPPKTFRLVRTQDISGVSGVGIVAQGVEWYNGRVTIAWLGSFPTIEHADNLHQIEELHGHDGSTKIEWDQSHPTFDSKDDTCQ